MIRFLLSFLFVCLASLSFSQGVIVLQDKPFVYNQLRDTAVWNRLVSSRGFADLSVMEQDFFYWTNLMRKNPGQFGETVLQEFLRQFPEASSPDAKSLAADLKKAQRNLPFLDPDHGLCVMASTHAKDLKSRNGIISHQSSTGKDFVQRIKEAGKYRCGAENVFVGTPDALDALILLLIDKGVKDKGHRKNLLDPSFTLMGASFEEMNSKKAVLVQDFGCK
ncbi:CAP domain-containing protein [Lacibacter sediminis]|uniref:CAP domain-containing protein n=1 Tax=Lacibacter sediminis TaxID=2760713 RepID=A0A7G5XGQ4_9BACT|nr:CAP domain-containing protein [Lacibacter sediminis]QNA44657.1 CAP domain-containing protein [Lacibacter sediminis]